jgi:hypothetical protein
MQAVVVMTSEELELLRTKSDCTKKEEEFHNSIDSDCTWGSVVRKPLTIA